MEKIKLYTYKRLMVEYLIISLIGFYPILWIGLVLTVLLSAILDLFDIQLSYAVRYLVMGILSYQIVSFFHIFFRRNKIKPANITHTMYVAGVTFLAIGLAAIANFIRVEHQVRIASTLQGTSQFVNVLCASISAGMVSLTLIYIYITKRYC